MASILREVLTRIENNTGPVSLTEMAAELHIDTGTLEGMLDHWVRKGKLRRTGGNATMCGTCGSAEGCPFVMRMPRSYELVTDDESELPDPPCNCCG